jgi:anti-sigma B factor antagonist
VSELAVSFERRGEVVVARLAGHLDIYTVPALRSRLTTAVPAETPLVLDLRGLELLDSSGLGALIALRNRAVAAGHRLGLVSEDGQLRDVLVIAGLDRAFVRAHDVDTACSLVTTASAPADGGPPVHAPRSRR